MHFFAVGTKLVITTNSTARHLPMKNLTKTTVILKSLDIELKGLLQTDIKNFKIIRSRQKQMQEPQVA